MAPAAPHAAGILMAPLRGGDYPLPPTLPAGNFRDTPQLALPQPQLLAAPAEATERFIKRF